MSSHSEPKPWLAVACLLFTMVIWSSAFVGIKIGLESYSPNALALFRYMIASGLLSLVLLCRKKRQTIPKAYWKYILLIGLFGFALYNIMLNYGEIYVSAATSSFIISQSPIITMLISLYILKEKMDWRMALGVGVSITGVIIIAISQRHTIAFTHGAIFTLIATCCGAIYTILQRKVSKELPIFAVVTWSMIVGTLLMSWALPELITDLKTASLHATLAVVYIAIFPAAIAYMTWAYALKWLPANKAVSFMYFVPLLTIFIEWLALGVLPLPLTFIGGVVAIFGAVIVNFRLLEVGKGLLNRVVRKL